MSTASTSYKKQDGTLAVLKSKDSVTWTPNSPLDAEPVLTILVSEITNLQQTPEKASKVSIKIVVQKPGAANVENYTFTFTSSSSARAEQVAITDILRKSIEAARAQSNSANAREVPAPNGSSEKSAAMAIAQAVSSTRKEKDGLFDDSNLISNIELQRSLLNANPNLQQRFEQALRERPESITMSQFSTQFWSSRVHLLREHAVQRSQTQGTYNVLSELKPKNADGEVRLRLSREQIQLIFRQHPLVKRVYDESVPQLSEADFWSRFFTSRLFKKLKGEKITEMDSVDPKLDRYLNHTDDTEEPRQPQTAQIPHFLDLEGNEQNHSQQKGNRPDWTMQPNAHEKVPILRVLNSMSEKLMAEVTPTDFSHGPAGMNEETFNELRLRDLQREDPDNRVMLKIKDQVRFMSGKQGDDLSPESTLYASQDVGKAQAAVSDDLRHMVDASKTSKGLDLEEDIGVRDDSSSEDEEGKSSAAGRIGSKSGRRAAYNRIMDAVKRRRAQTDDFSLSANSGSSAPRADTGLSSNVLDSLIMTHNTTIEFLHYFWSVFLSGDPDRATEVLRLVETLDKSLDRIKAIELNAEEERRERVEKEKKAIEDYQRRTGRKRKFDPGQIKGGADAVGRLVAPTVRAIKAATRQYREAYEAQEAAMARAKS